MKLWIARDKNGNLHIHRTEPKLILGEIWVSLNYWQLYRSEFPEVTFENSPKEIIINIVES